MIDQYIKQKFVVKHADQRHNVWTSEIEKYKHHNPCFLVTKKKVETDFDIVCEWNAAIYNSVCSTEYNRATQSYGN